jgi:hypothetical protein
MIGDSYIEHSIVVDFDASDEENGPMVWEVIKVWSPTK